MMSEFRKCCVVGTKYAIASTVGDACLGKLTHGYGCVAPTALPCGQREDNERAVGTNETQQDIKRADRYATTIAGGLATQCGKVTIGKSNEQISAVGTAHCWEHIIWY